MYIVRTHYWNALFCVGKCNKECNRSVSLTYKLGSIKSLAYSIWIFQLVQTLIKVHICLCFYGEVITLYSELQRAPWIMLMFFPPPKTLAQLSIFFHALLISFCFFVCFFFFLSLFFYFGANRASWSCLLGWFQCKWPNFLFFFTLNRTVLTNFSRSPNIFILYLLQIFKMEQVSKCVYCTSVSTFVNLVHLCFITLNVYLFRYFHQLALHINRENNNNKRKKKCSKLRVRCCYM